MFFARLGNGYESGVNVPHSLPGMLFYAFLWLIPWAILFGLAYAAFGIPFRRQERARLILDLVESGLRAGRSPEETIVSISHSQDRKLGVMFHLLAAHIETGKRFVEALDCVPGLLPRSVVGMLAVGDKMGDLGKILPACRRALTETSPQFTSKVNYMIVATMSVQPALTLVLLFMGGIIAPKLDELAREFGGPGLPWLFQWFVDSSWLVLGVQGALALVTYLVVAVYVAGPWVAAKLPRVARTVDDRMALWLTWRWKRLQRDFSAMLALLLDAGVAEMEAVRLAAESTANRRFVRRTESVMRQLKEGVALPDAMTALDDTGEFRWRLANAAHARSNFMAALGGWHEALDAQAYEHEQATSQVITTGLVLLNGLVVGVFVVSVFQSLTSIVQMAVLW